MSVDLIAQLEQRYSTKVFNPERKIDAETLATLKESLRLSPSSINSQPWHFFVVSTQEEKVRLAEAAWDYNQPKFRDASQIIVFCAKRDFTIADLEKIEQNVAETRNTEVSKERIAALGGYVESMTAEYRKEWTRQQAAMAFGQFMLSCQLVGVDCCPIGGFEEPKMDELLGLEEKGLTSVVVAAIGYRAEEDFNTPEKAAKARFSQEDIITEL